MILFFCFKVYKSMSNIQLSIQALMGGGGL